MNFIGIYFTLRFLFYLLFSEFEVLFPGLSEVSWKMDLLFLGIGPIYASNLKAEKIPLKRTIKYISLTPLIYILPGIVIFFYSLFTGIPEINKFLLALLDFSFSLYTMIFAIALSFKVGKDTQTKRELYILGAVSIFLWFITLRLNTNDKLFVLAHTLPFVWASWRFNKQS